MDGARGPCGLDKVCRNGLNSPWHSSVNKMCSFVWQYGKVQAFSVVTLTLIKSI